MRGVGWVNRRGASATLEIETDQGVCLRREVVCKSDRSGAKSDTYWVGSTDYTKFGSQLPPAITEALPVGPVLDVGEAIDLNFRQQSDSLFLLQSSPSTRAKVLGHSLCDVDKLDGLQESVGERFKSAKQSLESLSERAVQVDSQIERLESRLGQLSVVDSILVEVSSAEHTLIEVEAAKDTLSKFVVIQRELQEVAQELEQYKDLSILKSSLNEAEAKAVQFDNYQNVFTQYTEGVHQLQSVTEILSKIGDTSAVRQRIIQIEEMIASGKSWWGVLSEYRKYSEECFRVQDEIAEAALNMEAALGELSKFVESAEMCPTCGTPLSEDSRHYLISHAD